MSDLFNNPLFIKDAEIASLRKQLSESEEKRRIAERMAADFDAELEAHATDRVNQRAEVATLKQALEAAQRESMQGHKVFAEVFGEIMNGRDFSVKASIAKGILADNRQALEAAKGAIDDLLINGSTEYRLRVASNAHKVLAQIESLIGHDPEPKA